MKIVNNGDRVIPASVASGVWRNYMIVAENDLIKIPKDIPITTAATISVNPCTAFRMLHDFVVRAVYSFRRLRAVMNLFGRALKKEIRLSKMVQTVLLVKRSYRYQQRMVGELLILFATVRIKRIR